MDADYKELLKESDNLKRKMLFAGFLTNKLSEEKVQIIVVGGGAVEIYAAGHFSTGDLDLAVSDKKLTEALLKDLGFEKSGMVWVNEKLGIAVHVLEGAYSGDYNKTRIFKVGKYNVRLAAIEDLIVNRLSAAKYWKGNEQAELEQAKALLKIHEDRIDINYLEELAKKNQVDDFLAKIRS